MTGQSSMLTTIEFKVAISPQKSTEIGHSLKKRNNHSTKYIYSSDGGGGGDKNLYIITFVKL